MLMLTDAFSETNLGESQFQSRGFHKQHGKPKFPLNDGSTGADAGNEFTNKNDIELLFLFS